MNFSLQQALRPLSAAAAFIFSSNALAQDPAQTVIVTGTVVPRSQGSEIAATSVLTRAELERSGAMDLISALNLLGTAQVEQQGGSGTLAAVRLRGADARDTLVLVDGVPLNDVSAGQSSLQQLPVELIERVEVVRGNLSALYGGNATGGVIQIFTRRGVDGFDAQVKVGAGSRGTAVASASIAGGKRTLRGRLTVGGERTDGFSAINPAIRPTANPDDDGNRRRYAALAVDAEVAKGHGIGVDLRVVRGNAEYDSIFDTSTDQHRANLLQRGALLRGRHEIADWLIAWRMSDDDEARRDVAPFASANTLRNRALALDIAGPLADGFTVRAGAEKLKQATDNANYRRQREIDVARLGVQYEADWGSVQANIRHDRTSDFGQATTGLLGARWRFTPKVSAFGSLSKSFTPPTMDFLFFDCGNPAFPCSNPNLKPEESRNADVGLQWQDQRTLLRATLFAVRYSDKIANDENFVPQNIGRAKNRGVELAARTSQGAWQFSGEAVFQHPVDANTHQRLVRRTKRQLALRAQYVGGTFGIGGALRHVGERVDRASLLVAPFVADIVLPSYTVVDLSARWKITPQWTLQATLENAFNSTYQPVYGYNGRPRTGLLTLAWQLK